MANPLQCIEVDLNYFLTNKMVSSYKVENQEVYENSDYSCNQTNLHTIQRGILYDKCTFYEFPFAKSIATRVYHILILNINDSKLSKICSDNLKGFVSLKQLSIQWCEIKHLPGDLFNSNKINNIDPDIRVPIRYLKHFD
jgi:hypothetical protein